MTKTSPSLPPEGLRAFGLIREFVGRFAILAHTSPLQPDDLVKIMTQPTNTLHRQYQAHLAIDGIDLRLAKDAALAIANIAYSNNTGARGLRAVLETVHSDIMFDAAARKSDNIRIGAKYVNKKSRFFLPQ